MSRTRIVYQEWIVELGRDPSRTWNELRPPEDNYNETIIAAVNKALAALENEEAGLIRAYHMQGISFAEISKNTGIEPYKLESLHRRAMKKMKLILCRLLGGRYNIPAMETPACPICNHPDVDEINELIRSKTDRETWRRIFRILRDKYRVVFSTTQQLISHHKYHME